jgi:aldose 1-epimerase
MTGEKIKTPGKNTEEITLSNAALKVVFSSYGAGVRSIHIRKKDACFENIALTLKRKEADTKNPLYAGATLAPAAGRIENGVLYLDNALYPLTRNEQGKHHLHGGEKNLSFSLWDITAHNDHTFIFSNSLKDGVDGYPGNRKFSVKYTLDEHALEIRLHAESDKKTYFNLSNHTYFNLNAFSSSGLNQYLMIRAGQVVLNNEEHIPQNTINTAGTEFDFLTPVNIERRIDTYPESTHFRTARGLNHYFLLSENGESSPACLLTDADKKTTLRLYTDAPALVLYTGGFIDGSSHYENNGDKAAYPGCAIAMEPSYAPFFRECPYGTKEFNRFIRWEFEG